MSVALESVPSALVSVPEAAARLHVAPITIYRWVEADMIPGVLRIGNGKRRGIRLPAEWLTEYLRTGRMPVVRRIGRGARG